MLFDSLCVFKHIPKTPTLFIYIQRSDIHTHPIRMLYVVQPYARLCSVIVEKWASIYIVIQMKRKTMWKATERKREKKICIQNKSSAVLVFISVWHVLFFYSCTELVGQCWVFHFHLVRLLCIYICCFFSTFKFALRSIWWSIAHECLLVYWTRTTTTTATATTTKKKSLAWYVYIWTLYVYVCVFAELWWLDDKMKHVCVLSMH